ncbi:hypothetical protein NL676_001306 [Syzygium grande]|nr:hypothetical protein NL676_001306 [Syzygium grande]
MLGIQLSGVDVVLANYPPPPPKPILAKLVPVTQIGVSAIVMAREHFFQCLGLQCIPFSLCKRVGIVAATWLFAMCSSPSCKALVLLMFTTMMSCSVASSWRLVLPKIEGGKVSQDIELKDLIDRRLANSWVMMWELMGL